MPRFNSAKDVRAFRDELTNGGYTRIPQYRQVIDRKLNLDSLKEIIAKDYQKAFVPYQSGIPGKSLQRITNIMASNQSEIRYKARSTDPTKIHAVQRHEHGHEALDPLIFPIGVRRKMYSFLADSYTIVALDVAPKAGTLAKYGDREKLEKSADADYEDEDDSAEASYSRSYKRAKGTSEREKHESAYDEVTTDALLADGCDLRVRVVDPLTFKGFQTDDDACRFAEGMEYGQKLLNPLLATLKDYGVKVDNGVLYIDSKGKREKSASYQALGVGMIADSQSTGKSGDEYVEYTQVRTCEETLILIENVKGAKDADGEPGILIRVPNLFGQQSTGYYLIEGDAKLRSGDIEERYDPPLLNLMNEAQHYSINRTAYEAMAVAEVTRGLYQLEEPGAAAAIEPHDPTQETKSAHPEDGQPIPIAAGEVKRVEGFGQKLEAMLQHAREMMNEAEPTDIWGGTGSSSESGLAIARRETALLTELTPYQANVATVCKLIHQDIDRYVAENDVTIKLPYLAEDAESGAKPEIREITPKSARLAMDLDYTLGSDTPESKYAAEQMSERRWQMKLIGKLDHMENIGIKDPEAAERRQIEDDIVTGVMQIVGTAATELLGKYSQGAIQRELGPAPAPPQLVDQFGQPMPAGGAAGMPPSPAGPMQPPVQTQAGGVPVVPGGAPMTV